MKKSVCLSQDSNLGSLIYLYGLIQPIRGRNRVNKAAAIVKLPWKLYFQRNLMQMGIQKRKWQGYVFTCKWQKQFYYDMQNVNLLPFSSYCKYYIYILVKIILRYILI